MFGRKISRFAVAIAALSILGAGRNDARAVYSTRALTRADEPGGTALDGRLAKQNPDEYAWELFFFINRQAEPRSAGVPDPTIPTLVQDRPNADVVWESWALASGATSSTKEVFKDGAAKPVPWHSLRSDADAMVVLSKNLTNAVVPQIRAAATPIPPGGQTDLAEIRINERAYETITSGAGLWNKVKIRDRISRSPVGSFVDFPLGSKLTKAAWVQLCKSSSNCPESLKAHYHWRFVQNGASKSVWGLAALHIMAKEIKDGHEFWFWADFIERDCLEFGAGPCNRQQFIHSGVHIGVPHDSTTAASDGFRRETDGSKWRFYRLMGTQTEFAVNGTPTYLSNPVLEKEPDATSCITCHAYAAATARPLPSELSREMCHIQPDDFQPIYGAPVSLAFSPTPGSPQDHCGGQDFHRSDSVWSMILEPR